MDRLTSKKEADIQREEYKIRLRQGYPRNIPEERFLKLAAYEDTGLSPEDIQEVIDILNYAFPASDLPTELKSWAERCTWHVAQCDKLRKKLELVSSEKTKLEAELSIAKSDIAAILWLNGECRYCKYAKKIQYCGAERIECTLEKGSECRPEWNNGCT